MLYDQCPEACANNRMLERVQRSTRPNCCKGDILEYQVLIDIRGCEALDRHRRNNPRRRKFPRQALRHPQ